jgi:O-antigen ligase
MAWISLAKVLMFVAALGYLTRQFLTNRTDTALAQLWTPWGIVLMLIYSACSMVWSAADPHSALVAFVKHAKLLEVVLLVSLIRTVAEARLAIIVFACGQAFMLLSSWLMYANIDVPWHANAPTPYVVFSTYLDQSIMFATSASVFWHLRNDRLWPTFIGIILAVSALANVFFVLKGRTGYLIAIASVSLGLMWTLPKRMRLRALIIGPLVIFGVTYISSAQLQERVFQVLQETKSYTNAWGVDPISSSGWRLNAWHRSLQAIYESPLTGHGVGGWPVAVKRIEGIAATQLFGDGNQSNPHQEYLLWGVELGVGGLLLLLSALVCIARDALRFPEPVKRATLAVLAAIVIACLFNSALYDDLLGDFLCVNLGLLMALGTRTMVHGNIQIKISA